MAATPEIPRRLPRGTHGLDRRLVVESQRTRLLEAVGRAVAEKGYSDTTIDDIVRGAGVSKKTFYEHFSDKEDCFVSAYEVAAEQLFERVRDAQLRNPEDDWLERTRAGIVAYLRWLAAEPALARVFLIEVPARARPRAASACATATPSSSGGSSRTRAPTSPSSPSSPPRSSTQSSRRSTTASCASSGRAARRTCCGSSRSCATSR